MSNTPIPFTAQQFLAAGALMTQYGLDESLGCGATAVDVDQFEGFEYQTACVRLGRR
jgi:hypothetical protein